MRLPGDSRLFFGPDNTRALAGAHLARGSRAVLGYPDEAFATRGRGGRSATVRDICEHARPSQPASGL